MEDQAVQEKQQLNKHEETGSSRVYPNKLIAFKPGVCLGKQGAQGLTVLSKAWNIRLGICQVFRKFQSQNLCLLREDMKASVIKEDDRRQIKAYEQVRMGREADDRMP